MILLHYCNDLYCNFFSFWVS